jgi:hypothetical protein
MNIKLIIASLVLGSSSLAMATPSVQFTSDDDNAASTATVESYDGEYRTLPAPAHRPAPAPTYRGGWYSGSWNGGWNDRRDWSRPAYRGPVTLASGVTVSNDGRTFINVGRHAGRFGRLEINAESGRTFIKQVYVQFDNGQEQVVRNLDARLGRNQTVTIDLDGGRRAIRRIVVYGGNVNNHWRPAPAAITVTAV